jgi:hypothetical protein
MAGNSGKMTNEAIAARGPRMVLARLYRQGWNMLVIYREGQEPFNDGRQHVGVLAKSYSLSYLKKVGRGNL